MRQNRTLTKNAALIALSSLCWVASTLVQAGIPSSITPSPFASNTLSSPIIGQFGAATPITVLCSNGGLSGNGCRIEAFGLAGANASDFAVVGGSCNPGVTLLTNGETCTVTLQYKPSGAAQETALLQAKCVTVSVIGGFSVVCNNNLQSFDTLFGIFLPPVATPALNRVGITLLTLLVLCVGGYFSLRRAPLRR